MVVDIAVENVGHIQARLRIAGEVFQLEPNSVVSIKVDFAGEGNPTMRLEVEGDIERKS